MSAPPVCWIVRNAAVGELLLYETALCLDKYAWQLPSMAAMTGQRQCSSALREACRPKSGRSSRLYGTANDIHGRKNSVPSGVAVGRLQPCTWLHERT